MEVRPAATATMSRKNQKKSMSGSSGKKVADSFKCSVKEMTEQGSPLSVLPLRREGA